MSIAAISRSFATALQRTGSAPAAVAAAAPLYGVDATGREPGRRHELVAALNQALGANAADGASRDQATRRFAHALMHDLRSLDGGAGRGRREWGDLSQRLSALATATVVELPDQPNPVTTATMAVHIMKVPSSRLLEAFASLQRALGQQQSAPQSDARPALADLARRLAAAVAPGTVDAAPASGWVDLSA